MNQCLNLKDVNIAKLVKDFGETTVSKMINTHFGENIPTYEEFINNKSVKQELNLVPVSKTKEEIGTSFSKELNSDRLIKLKQTISRKNNLNYNAGNPVTYVLYNVNQLGESDLYTWGLRKLEGSLNVEAKLERAKNKLSDINDDRTNVSTLEKMIESDDVFLPEEEYMDQEVYDYEEEARRIQREDAERAGLDYTDDRYLYQEQGRSLSTITKEEINDLQNTVDYQLLNEQNQELSNKGGATYVFLKEKDAEKFAYLLEKHNEFPKTFRVTSVITKYERDSKNSLKYNGYNIYKDFEYIKSNNNKKSNLYDIVDLETGEILASKVRVLHLSQDSKSKIADKYGVEYTPTKVFNANRSIAFALYRQKPSKAKYVAQAKKYLYDAIKFLNPEESNLTINLDQIESFLESFPEDMWDYINTTYSSENSTNVNASISLQNDIKFNLPKLGLIKELEKITELPLLGVSFKNYDRTNSLQKAFKYSDKDGGWGKTITIDSSLTERQLKSALGYYLTSKNIFKPSSEEENVKKYAEHRGIDYNELKELVFGDMDKALENVAYNTSGNSDTIEVSKWRESVRNYDWQLVELFSIPYENFQNTVKERITEKFKDKNLSNGISHLEYFFNSNSFNWLNINFNNISGEYYASDMETKANVGVESKTAGIINPFEIKLYKKPIPGKTFLKEEEVFNRLAAIMHEPFHALHALSYGTKEEKDLRKAFDKLYNTEFGKEMLEQTFGSGYNQGQQLSYDVLYKEFTAFSAQLMLYPKEWIQKTDLRSNDIFEFIQKIQTLQDKTYEEVVISLQKIGEIEKETNDIEFLKLSFLEKLYNFIVKALNKIIPLSKKFFKTIADNKTVNKTVVEDVFGSVEETVTKTVKLPENIKASKEEFLTAMDELKSAINVLMQIDSKAFSSDNIKDFFTGDKNYQETGAANQTLEDTTTDQVENVPIEYSEEAVDRVLNRKIDAQRALDLQEEVIENDLAPADPQKETAKNIAIEFAKKLSAATGMEYKLISEAEAEALLANSPTPYGNQAAFFHGNTIYLINGRISLDNVLHEFAHPIVKGILKQNPTLFNNLYALLESTPEGQDIIAEIKEQYPNLEEGSDRFKEEAIVHSLERKAVSKVNSESPFGKFIKNLMFAIKKVIRSMFNSKNATSLNLNKLNEKTTLDELAKMLANPEFRIEDLTIEASDIAEFKNEITDKIEELSKVPQDKLQETINRMYTDTLSQLNTLKQAPFKVKQELLSAKGTKILGYVKEELEKYQTVNIKAQDVDPNNILNAIADQEEEMKLRALALINSLNELKVFADSISNILTDIQNSKDKNTNANISKVVYYKGFLNNQSKLLADLKDIPGLDTDGEFYRKINSINDKIIKAEKQIKAIEFDFISQFFKNETDLMEGAVENNFRERVSLIMKAEGISEADIEKFIQKIINNPEGKTITIKDIELPLNERRAKYVVDAAKEYYFKRLGTQQIEEYLRGERGDLGYFTAWITPYSNMDDPITGGFVNFIKGKMADAMTKSQNQADEITIKLLPLLNAVGYNPAKTNQLGDMLLFTDKVGYTNNEGEFEEKEVLTFINKFKNYRADRARLQNDFDAAKAKKDSIKMKEAYEAIEAFDEKYMHRKFTKAYYDIQKIWKTGAKVVNPFTGEEITVNPKIAFDAFLERQAGLDKINTLKNVHFLELEDLYELGDSEQQAKLEYNRLFDVYGLDGKPKTGEELERVLLRKRHRELSRSMYDYPVDTDRIQKDLDNFAQKLAARNINPDDAPKEGETMNTYQKEMERFFRKNLKTAYTSEYYKSRQQIFEDIKKISEKAGVKSKVALELAELYKERYRLSNSTSDANGQPNGLNFTPEQIDLLRNIENKIIELEQLFDKKTGMTKEELSRLKTYINKTAQKIPLTQDELADFGNLYKIKNDMALTPLELQALQSKFRELAEISTKQATDYYIEAFNYAIRNLGLSEITVENADEWINSDLLTQALAGSKEFAQWYTRNHIEKSIYQPGIGKVNKNYRLNVWTITKPSNENAYQKTKLIDPITKEVIEVDGVPAGKYSRSVIKNEFLTVPKGESWEKYVGTYIDNKGNYLPREYKPGDVNSAYDNKYMNEKYAELEKADNAEFKLLKTMSEEFVKLQDGKAVNSRLYLDLPRFRRRSNLEYLASGEAKDNFLKRIGSFKDIWDAWFGKAPDDVEYGYNFDISTTLVSTDLEGNPVTKIPVRGTYNLDANLVSKDVLRSTYEYLLSLNEQQALMENEPVADALMSVLSDNPIKDTTKLDKGEFKLTGKKKYIDEKDNLRKDAIDYLVNKIFYGKQTSTFEEKHPVLTKTLQGMFRRSSRAFMAFDPQSAIKNRWGMLYQNAIQASGGKYVTVTSLAKGKAKAKESAMYWVFKDIYAKGMKTQDIQLIERFDPALRAEQEFGKSSSRSIAKDVLDMTYAYDFRKTMELEASMELFWGVMYNKYVDQNGVSISYADAWTTDSEGRLQLKEGIDPNFGFREVKHTYTAGETLADIAKQYNISEEALKGRTGINSVSELTPGEEITVGDGKEFRRMKILVQGINKKVTGTLDRFDTPQAEKYIWYRAFTFYKRFATGMFLDKYQFDTTSGNRFGHVYNWDTMTLEKGYYPAVFQNIYKLVKSLLRDWPLLTQSEKAAMKKVLAEGLMLFLLAMLVGSWGFGYDPEDKDRFAKMKERNETWSGYYGNHLLYLLIATKSENEAFVPGLGMSDQANYFSTTTIATVNTLDLYIKIMKDIYNISTDNPDAIYSQDVGPYEWQKQNRYKLWNHIGTAYGVKGKNKDAMWAIKKFETYENTK
jgi:hypothetical protein